jgi:hypothetical protein
MELAEPMPKARTLTIVAAIVASFAVLVGTIILLLKTKVVSFELAMLMLVALFGIYFGFGVLIAIYRLTGKLE